jgi:putative transposase
VTLPPMTSALFGVRTQRSVEPGVDLVCKLLGHHLLLSEPKRSNLSTAMQVLKQRVSRHLRQRSSRPAPSRRAVLPSGALDDVRFWQLRFHDFNVYTRHKFVEKLRYIHRNPVKRGLVIQPDQWRWSSFRFYAYD